MSNQPLFPNRIGTPGIPQTDQQREVAHATWLAAQTAKLTGKTPQRQSSWPPPLPTHSGESPEQRRNRLAQERYAAKTARVANAPFKRALNDIRHRIVHQIKQDAERKARQNNERAIEEARQRGLVKLIRRELEKMSDDELESLSEGETLRVNIPLPHGRRLSIDIDGRDLDLVPPSRVANLQRESALQDMDDATGAALDDAIADI